MEERTRLFLEWYSTHEKTYQEFAQCVLDKMLSALKERKIIYAYSTSRAKSLDSLTEKCNKKLYNKETESYVLKYNNPRKQITDLAGARVVCYLPQDIVPIQNVIKSLFQIDAENSMNKAALLNADKVGYLSVHYVVSLKEESLSPELRVYKDMKCEIQLRTVLQDAWSQIFHDRQYKSSGGDAIITQEMLRETNLISGALELIDNEIGNLVARYDELAEKMDNVAYQDLLDQEISRESMEKYFKLKFARIGLRFYSYNDISKVLNKFGLRTLRDIDALLDDGLIQAICSLERQLTIDKILTYGMIVNDGDKFFQMEENRGVIISSGAYDLLDKFVDMETICIKYDLMIKK